MIYFDNAATTKPYNEVCDAVYDAMKNIYGNPSSLHTLGMEAEKHIIEAKKTISKILKVNEKELIFTSGGTEANNMAILGAAKALIRDGKHIITSTIEHPSVLHVFKFLEQEGYEVTLLPVDENGVVNVDELANHIREDTVLVSLMHVNNEVGTIQPIKEIAKNIKASNPRTLFHVDGVQAFGKVKVFPKKWGIDFYTMSGHKIHGPKGIGMLYMNEKAKIKPLVYGGNQQYGLRSGTEDVPNIIGLHVAIKKILQDLEKNEEHLYNLKSLFLSKLFENCEDIQLHGSQEKSSPYIINVSFKGVKSEVLLHTLESEEIYVSSGSACSSNKPEKSHVLKAMGVNDSDIDSSIRFSFSAANTVEEIDRCLRVIQDKLPMLRKFIKK